MTATAYCSEMQVCHGDHHSAPMLLRRHPPFIWFVYLVFNGFMMGATFLGA